MTTQVIELVGNGANQVVNVGHANWQWQLQYRNGAPLISPEHLGKRRSDIIILPPVPQGVEFQLLLVENE